MKIKKGFRLRPLGAEFIVSAEGLKQVNFNKLISLNSSAAYLWESVEGLDFDENTLAELLVGKYEIKKAEALQDATEMIDLWLKAEIIEP